MRFLAMAALVLMVALVGCSRGVEAPPPAQDVGTPVETAVARALPTATPTATPQSTATPTSSPMTTPAATPISTPTPTPIPVPTATPAPTPTPTPVPTAIPTPTPTPSPTPTPAPPTLLSTYDTKNTRWLVRNYPTLARQIQMLAWVQDGLSDLERSAVDELLWIAVEDVANLEAALRVSWVQDDIQEAEYQALDKLGYLDTPSPANLYAALNLSWVQDDISETEYDIIDSLGALDFDAPDVVFQLLSMPFLISPDTTDALAIQGMENLADGGRLSALTDHSIFQDGITDDETTLIAAVGTLRGCGRDSTGS